MNCIHEWADGGEVPKGTGVNQPEQLAITRGTCSFNEVFFIVAVVDPGNVGRAGRFLTALPERFSTPLSRGNNGLRLAQHFVLHSYLQPMREPTLPAILPIRVA